MSYMTNSQMNKLDSLFQERVLEKWKHKSVLTGEPATVVHHFIGRSGMSTRWFLPNGIALTHEEHMHLHDRETEQMKNCIIERLGTLWHEELQKVGRKIAKYLTYEDVLAHLQGEKDHYLKDWYV